MLECLAKQRGFCGLGLGVFGGYLDFVTPYSWETLSILGLFYIMSTEAMITQVTSPFISSY